MSASEEWGVFNDEGLVEGEFWHRDTAVAAMEDDYPEDAAYVARVCPVCRENDLDSCPCQEG